MTYRPIGFLGYQYSGGASTTYAAAGDVEGAAGAAALEEIEDSSWPPTESDMKSAGSTVGAVAGVAACTAYGLAAAAPVCAAVGGAVGEFLVGAAAGIANAISSFFGRERAPDDWSGVYGVADKLGIDRAVAKDLYLQTRYPFHGMSRDEAWSYCLSHSDEWRCLWLRETGGTQHRYWLTVWQEWLAKMMAIAAARKAKQEIAKRTGIRLSTKMISQLHKIEDPKAAQKKAATYAIVGTAAVGATWILWPTIKAALFRA